MIKITKTEHVVITLLLILCAVVVVQISSCGKEVDNSGGARQMIVDVGKEIKSIYDEIVED